MPENPILTSRETKHLALALVQVVQMWSDERYGIFLLPANPGELTEKWFRWFAGAWNVARTIKDGRQELVREYLDADFRQKLSEGGGAEIVDAAAEHIQQQGWSSTKRKNGQGSLPISLVSKIGFFLCPSRLVPLDRYALQGLNGQRRMSGSPRLKGQSYREYLGAFNEQYARMEPVLAAALSDPWVIALADKLGCPPSALTTIAMRRKLFDDYLMHSGNYLR
jgi:hypothetical protein